MGTWLVVPLAGKTPPAPYWRTPAKVYLTHARHALAVHQDALLAANQNQAASAKKWLAHLA